MAGVAIPGFIGLLCFVGWLRFDGRASAWFIQVGRPFSVNALQAFYGHIFLTIPMQGQAGDLLTSKLPAFFCVIIEKTGQDATSAWCIILASLSDYYTEKSRQLAKYQ